MLKTMARPLRIEFSGALYHVTARGDRRETIFEDDKDCLMFLRTLAEVVERFNWLCHAYCLMTNHYHLLVETPEGNLSKGMRHLNGVYTQASNRRHNRIGHLFQGRFKGILIDKDSYLLELSRYVVLNPVRARMVKQPEKWKWSSYQAMIGEVSTPSWLAIDGLLAPFGNCRASARQHYKDFVRQGINAGSIWNELRQQIYLGDERFVKRMLRKARKIGIQGDEQSIPQAQRQVPAVSLDQIADKYRARNDAIIAAYATGAYSYREIAEHFGLHLATIGRIVRGQMQQCKN